MQYYYGTAGTTVYITLCVVSLNELVHLWKVSARNLTDYWDNILTIVCCGSFLGVD